MEHLVSYTPQQNGVSERKNRSLKEMETCLLHPKHIPPSLWDEVVNCHIPTLLRERENATIMLSNMGNLNPMNIHMIKMH